MLTTLQISLNVVGEWDMLSSEKGVCHLGVYDDDVKDFISATNGMYKLTYDLGHDDGKGFVVFMVEKKSVNINELV